MDVANLGPLPRFGTIGLAEKTNLNRAMKKPLSGYLGGWGTTGYWVNKLQDDWASTFGSQYAIACNSATSGLMAACMAVGVQPGSRVWVPAYTMSATVACAKVLGASVAFIDIETMRFSMNLNLLREPFPKCIIVTNLFGHPAYLANIRSWCDSNKVWMIEDNSQSPFATESGKYSGTFGHLGVFSLNVHKHMQAGEGGVVVTNSEELAKCLHDAINHGELTPVENRKLLCGLNLRMTEPTAAIASAQLAKGPGIIEGRRELAQQLNEMVKDYSFIKPPVEDEGCRHVYYMWAAQVDKDRRDRFVDRLQQKEFPIRKGYTMPMDRLFTHAACPEADRMEDEALITFEMCAHSPRKHHLRRMADIIKWAAENED